MGARNPQAKPSKYSCVGLAVAALEPRANPLDMPMAGVDPSPTALDLGEGKKAGTCPHHYICAECGRPLREGGA